VKGLELGGDGYMPKPYDNRELLLNIEALLRQREQMPKTVTKGALSLRINSNQAFVNGVDIGVSQNIEFSLLNIFVQEEGKVLSPEYLYDEAWGQPMNENDNALKVAISELRRKLEGSGCMITTERGKGYRFVVR
jgi:DNA-binding response OmpR family regulator